MCVCVCVCVYVWMYMPIDMYVYMCEPLVCVMLLSLPVFSLVSLCSVMVLTFYDKKNCKWNAVLDIIKHLYGKKFTVVSYDTKWLLYLMIITKQRKTSNINKGM